MTPIDNQLLILMPVFNDWDSVTSLLDEIDGVLSQEALAAEVLVVDDGSLAAAPGALRSKQLRWITKVDILQLRRNVGHQRAIGAGPVRHARRAPVHQSRDSRLGNIHNGRAAPAAQSDGDDVIPAGLRRPLELSRLDIYSRA